ncbi:MAG: hypothetical protein QGF59_10905, partial [Pirellulaceae bacterium]|nr:hypothetical protein [Pirellulaceae bacterium]
MLRITLPRQVIGDDQTNPNLVVAPPRRPHQGEHDRDDTMLRADGKSHDLAKGPGGVNVMVHGTETTVTTPTWMSAVSHILS